MTRKKTPDRRATSADVAREAGVSRATVSFVLNDTPGQTIPEDTRRRVLAAATALRYQPSAAARVLRSGRSDIVLLLMPGWSSGELVARTLDVMSQEFSERGMTFLVHPRAGSNRHLSDLWRDVTPALVITVDPLGPHELSQLDAAGIAHLPFRLGEDGAALGASQDTIGRIQAEHLVGLGHRRLGYAMTADASLIPFAEPRLRGVGQVCAEHGLPAPVVLSTPPGTAAGQAMRAWRAAGVTAVAAYNDEVALALLAAARQTQVVVPDDLAVIGADDIGAAALASPPLTTVRFDPATLVPALVASILRSIGRDTGEPGPATAPAEVVARGSTRRAR
ncbi:LacI family transcriptional regulator [Catellatospora sp. TT07R-123]|uniref:LacI family DNA-binding transcriptional regulator n=1 Tax=Catellatospora sp. TT07R-123 TaxID=2733863 RepID=UPI001B254264|nr:LacI family DNA-binding transcriptional regulator [Catellatospora sp. TT07R-123]GHJ47235.1 LacI family transcriptional regulator [Catellatospora sp. TT07R-123]